MRRLTPISSVPPGGAFIYHGLRYFTATESEAARHPGQELARRRGRTLVLAYSGQGDGRQPVTFVPDLDVVVEVPQRRRKAGAR